MTEERREGWQRRGRKGEQKEEGGMAEERREG